MAGHLYMAAAGIECRLKQAPRIEVVTTDTKVKYDHTKTQEQLDKFDVSTLSPYGRNIRTHVGGLMNGEVSLVQNTAIMKETYPSANAGCLYVHKITVKIHINPTIYIAKDYSKSGCMYHAIMEHEKKHIAVDRDIINKYAPIIESGLKTFLKKNNYAYGPFNAGDLAGSEQKIRDIIQGKVKQYANKMSDERQARQQAVDSLQEYERVRMLCEGKQ